MRCSSKERKMHAGSYLLHLDVQVALDVASRYHVVAATVDGEGEAIKRVPNRTVEVVVVQFRFRRCLMSRDE
jgi:hypothetical protein